jgi:large subunit ribosomal protein L6
MSRIGKQPITIPTGVTVQLENDIVTVTGPKGTLHQTMLPGLALKIDDGVATVSQTEVTPDTQKTFGLIRTLIDNMIIGVSTGFTRALEINGVGFRAAVSGNKITLNLGFSHPVIYNLPTGVDAVVDKNILTISGYDKQAVGQVAANLRSLKKPEPYKGKGIKYVEETIRRKAGKTAAKG